MILGVASPYKFVIMNFEFKNYKKFVPVLFLLMIQIFLSHVSKYKSELRYVTTLKYVAWASIMVSVI